MAGIKLLEKRPGNMDFIINELTKPEIRSKMFDDAIGGAEISLALYDPFTMVYGIFEKGLPVPIGTIILEGVRPFRGCEIHAVIFNESDRYQGKLKSVVGQIRDDMINKWNLHWAGARVLSTNGPAKRLLEGVGMMHICTKEGNISVNGQYADVDEYYIILNGDRLFSLEDGGLHGRKN